MSRTPAGVLVHALRTRRESMGLSQAEVARRIGMSRTSITNFEGGRQDLAMSRLLAFADVVDLRLVAVPAELVDVGDQTTEVVLVWQLAAAVVQAAGVLRELDK